MRRYWVSPQNRSGDILVIEGQEFHHIFDVCRRKEGDEFEVLLGDSHASLVRVESIGKKSAQVRIQSQRRIDPLPQPYLHLILCVPRFPVFESILERCVELGVKSVTPVLSQNSFVHKVSDLSENRLERWKKIIVSATQQSGRGELMDLGAATRLQETVRAFNPSAGQTGLFLYEGDAESHLGAWVKSQKTPSEVRDIYVFVGGEGGFSPEEVELFQQVGLQPVTLGPQVLRVETACLAALSVLKYEWNLMR